MTHTLAVMADPHYWDPFPGYDLPGVPLAGRDRAMVHTLSDSARSTRLFNEGYFALPAALDRCVAEGIRTVVIPGDLSDDGQMSAMKSAVALLDAYRARHGMRFFLCPGNHDAHSMAGRDIPRRFLQRDGTSVTVTSDPDLTAEGPLHVEPRQRCLTYPELFGMWAPLGQRRDPRDLHWESPFGPDDDPQARMFDISSASGRTKHRQLDLSYLVEPEPGLWLLSIDANIYVPIDGFADNLRPDAFADSTAAGWNRLVIHKPFLLGWMRDVSSRARQAGKTLIAFSHYPVTDVFGGAMRHERALMGDTMSVLRTPAPETVAAVCATGIGVHFSGHMHILNRTEVQHGDNRLINHAMPSLQAFPAAWGRVTADPGRIMVDIVPLETDGFRALIDAYRPEAARTGNHQAWLGARDYGDYLFRQLREQVEHRTLPQEWPAVLAQPLLSMDLCGLLPESRRPSNPADHGFLRLLADVQALRMGGPAAMDHVPPARLQVWRDLSRQCTAAEATKDDALRALGHLMAMFDCFDRIACTGRKGPDAWLSVSAMQDATHLRP
jgi:3',5'-cyclic AMP phosphodiesterase CpdA